MTTEAQPEQVTEAASDASDPRLVLLRQLQGDIGHAIGRVAYVANQTRLVRQSVVGVANIAPTPELKRDFEALFAVSTACAHEMEALLDRLGGTYRLVYAELTGPRDRGDAVH